MKKIIIPFALILLLGSSCSTRYPYSSVETFFKDPRQAALTRAAVQGYTKGIDSQLAKGANVNYIGEHGMTALMWSLIYGNRSGFEHLLKLGANPNIPLEGSIYYEGRFRGHSVTSLAVRVKDTWFLETALKYGGDPNFINEITGYPLIWGCVGFKVDGYPDNIDRLNILIKYHVNLNNRTDVGVTLMQSAASFNRYDMIYIMLQAGADPTQNSYALIREMNKTATPEDTDLYQWRIKVVKLLQEKEIIPAGDNRLYQNEWLRKRRESGKPDKAAPWEGIAEWGKRKPEPSIQDLLIP